MDLTAHDPASKADAAPSQVNLIDDGAAAPRGCSASIVAAIPDFVTKASYLETVPASLKRGPRSPAAIVWLVLAAAALAGLSVAAARSFPLAAEWPRDPAWLVAFRGAFGLAGAAVLALCAARSPWVFVTFTMQSFAWLTLRLLLSALGGASGAAALAPSRVVAVVLRFPALAQTSLTVLVWWGVLTPLITAQLWGSSAGGGAVRDFWRFNLSPMLLTVHLLNLPVAAVEFVASGVALRPFDLWVALAFALLYLSFYLAVLDANHVHLYIILTPRTPACCVTYSLLLGLYVAFYYGWNAAVV